MSIFPRCILVLLLPAGVLALLAAAEPKARPAAPSRFTITDLGALPGFPGGMATHINNRGDVIGILFGKGGARHAFLWQKGRMRDLGSVNTDGNVWYINNKGQILGEVGLPGGVRLPFLWQNGKRREFRPPPGYEVFIPLAINDQGLVAGHAIAGAFPTEGRSPRQRAFLWQDGKFRDLGAMGQTESSAVDVNGKGQVLGFVRGSTVGDHTFLWEKGTMRDLGPGTARAFNDHGQIIGLVQESAGSSWMLLSANGHYERLGSLGNYPSTEPKDINNQGQVAGWTSTPTAPLETRDHPFLWERGKTCDLQELIPPRSGWDLTQAIAINDSGQIVGTGSHGTENRGFLLTPKGLHR